MRSSLSGLKRLFEIKSNERWHQLTSPLTQEDANLLDTYLTDAGLHHLELHQLREFKPAQLLYRAQTTNQWQFLQWMNITNIFEKTLYFFLINWPYLQIEQQRSVIKRFLSRRQWLQGGSLLLSDTKTLRCAYMSDAFILGTKLIFDTGIHITIYSLVLYQWIMGRSIFNIFKQGEQNILLYLTNLIAGALSGNTASVLRTTVSISLMIIPFVYGLWIATKYAKQATYLKKNDFDNIITKLVASPKVTLTKFTDIIPAIRDTLSWFLPFNTLSTNTQLLSYLMSWDANLSVEQRNKAELTLSDLLHNYPGHTQAIAAYVMTKQIWSNAFGQLLQLKSDYSQQRRRIDDGELKQIIITKMRFFRDLYQLSKGELPITAASKWHLFFMKWYARYLLWTIGVCQNKKISALFYTVSFIRLSLLFRFFVTLVQSIANYIRCPNRSGFDVFKGYSAKSFQLPVQCFINTINAFGVVPGGDITSLTSRCTNFYLKDYHTVALEKKGLTGEQVQGFIAGLSSYNTTFITQYSYPIIITALRLESNAISMPNDISALLSATQPSVTYVDLSRNYLADPVVSQTGYKEVYSGLKTYLCANPQIETLMLSGNSLGVQVTTESELLIDGIQCLTHLQRLNLSDNSLFLSAPFMRKLATVLSLKTTLIELDLSISETNDYYTADMVENQALIIPAISKLLQLQTIRLSYANLGLHSNYLLELASSLSKLGSITSIHLNSNNIQTIEAVNALSDAFKNKYALVDLNLYNNVIGIDGTIEANTHNSGIIALVAALSTTPNLRTLNMGLNPISMNDAVYLNAELGAVTQLTTFTRGIRSPENIQLFIASHSLRTYATIDYSDLLYQPTVAEVTALVCGTAQHFKDIQSLDLSDNSFGASAISKANPSSSDGTVALANCLSTPKFANTLRRLTLSNNNLAQNGIDGLIALVKTFESISFPELYYLNLSDNPIGDSEEQAFPLVILTFIRGLLAMPKLSELIFKNTLIGASPQKLDIPQGTLQGQLTITYLDLSHNNIGLHNQDYIRLITIIISLCTDLRVLKLNHNYIGYLAHEDSQPVIDLIDAIKRSTNLVELYMSDNFIGYNGTQSLVDKLDDAVLTLTKDHNLQQFTSYGPVPVLHTQATTEAAEAASQRVQTAYEICKHSACFSTARDIAMINISHHEIENTSSAGGRLTPSIVHSLLSVIRSLFALAKKPFHFINEFLTAVRQIDIFSGAELSPCQTPLATGLFSTSYKFGSIDHSLSTTTFQNKALCNF